MELVIPHRFRYMAVEVFSFTDVTSTWLLVVVQQKGEHCLQFAVCSLLLKSRFMIYLPPPQSLVSSRPSPLLQPPWR